MMTILHLSVLECAYILAFQTIDTKPSNTGYFFIDDLMTNQLTLDLLIKRIVVIISEFGRLWEYQTNTNVIKFNGHKILMT